MIRLDRALIDDAARACGVAWETVIEGAWALLLSRYGDSDEVVFGVAILDRRARAPSPGEPAAPVNPEPARVEISEDAAVGEWLAGIDAEAVARRRRAGSIGDRPPIDPQASGTVVVFEDAPGGAVTPGHFGHPPPAPLLVVARLEGRAPELRLHHDLAVHAADDVARLGAHLELALRDMADPDRALATVRTLDEQERDRLLGAWNETARPYDLETTVDELFARQAARTPAAPALAAGGGELTYRELDERANRLAHRLCGLGVGRGTLVALCLDRSIEMMVALLATLKAGGAYVPVGTDYPPERIAYLLEDTGAPVLLTQATARDRVPAVDGLSTVTLDGGWDRGPSVYPPTPPEPLSGPDDLAYVIYTSGSSGRPKGVQVAHRAVVNRLAWMQEAYAISASDRVLQKTPYTFDVSVWELLWPLLYGARLTLARPGGQRDPDYVAELIAEERITIAHFVPSALVEFLRSDRAPACTCLRQVVTSGEALGAEAARAFHDCLPGVRLDNLYGPTECCVDVTAHACRPEESTIPPIGRPIANTRAYIVDRRLRPVPVGVPGELCIAGVQLARGYLNLPERTAAAFVDCPFEPGERMYRTGDVCRWRADGEIDYLGRRDGQVKIRGHRIELGEIQARVGEHPDIAQAAVIVREDRPAERRIVAYVVPAAGGREPRSAELRRFLEARLPPYMIPAAFVALAELPLTAHAKLDRGALPAPGEEREVDGAYAAPEDPAEETLARIWREVLGLREVGVDDNFFELGGDSILGIKAVSRAREAGLAVSVRALFEQPTVRELAAAAAANPAREVVGAEQVPLEGDVPLGPIQAEFLSWAPEGPDWFNQSILVEIPPECGPEQLHAALLAVVCHHDALRLRLRRTTSGWRQRYAPADEPSERLLSLCELDLAAAGDLRDAVLPLQRRLDAERGPIVSAALVRRAEARRPLLFLTCHHLAVDAVSWQILLEDLHAALERIEAGEEPGLPLKTTSFGAWVELLRARPEAFEEELEMWKRAGSHRTALGLEADGGAPVETTTLSLGRDRVADLARAQHAYRTRADDLLVCALAGALSELTGNERIRIDVEGHGREPVFADADLTRTVGWFTALYPLVLDVPGTEAEAIKEVKEALRAVPHRGLGYGVLRHLAEAGAPLRAQPRADVVFNNLGRAEEGDLLGGLGGRGDRPPAHARSHPLTLAVATSEDELRLDLTFQGTPANRATVERLGDLYLECLEALVDHCLSDAAGGFTPSDFPLAGLDQPAVDRIAAAYPGLEDVYGLSSVQLGMLYHSLRDPEGGYYVQQDVSTFEGTDGDTLARAWLAALQRHPIMRTSIVWEGLDEPVQVVEREVSPSVRELDWRDAAPAEREERRRRLLADDRRRGFDFPRGPLWRLTLIRVSEAGWEVVWSAHHVLLDAWSGHRLREDVSRVLAAAGDASALEPVRPVRDHIAWLSRQDAQAAERFWSDHLAGLDGPTPLALAPPDDPRPGQARRVRRGDAAAARSFARHAGLTLNTVVQGAWALVVSRLSGRDDVVLGTTTSGRAAELPGAEAIVGCLINTLPVRVRVEEDAPVADWLRELQTGQGRTRAFEYASLAEIQRLAGLEHGEQLFETLLVFDYEEASAGVPGVTRIGELSRTNYPLTIVVVPDGDQLELRVLHDTERFDAATVDRLASYLFEILSSLAGAGEAALGTVELLGAGERRRVVHRWNQTRLLPSDAPSAVERWERRVEEAPDAIALVGEEGSLTYGALAERVGAIAVAARAAGAERDAPVGLLAEGSPAMVAALLGVLRAGAAYLPLDPADPPERVKALLADAGAGIVAASDAATRSHAEALGERTVLELAGGGPQAAPLPSDLPYPAPADLAYVIYTSGSTGHPKGVAVEHRSLSNLVDWMSSQFEIGPGDRVLVKTPIPFDASIAPELIVSPCCGATMVLAPDGAERDPAALAELIARERVTVAKFVPVALAALLECDGLADCDSLREVFVAGEPLSRELVEAFYRAMPSARLHNLYGPTEATVDATFHTTRPGEAGPPPIGRPIGGARCYVTDPALRPLPVGATGELVIGGAGVARGYRSDPELTAERFLENPFVAGERVYRTGDLARRRADGTLELVGRADDQLKVRGHRVEPEEVRAALEGHPGVRAAAVAAHPRRDGDGKLLTGYVVSGEGGRSPSADELRAHLASRLPDYMIPQAFVPLESLPLTRAGKVDRAALRPPGGARLGPGSAYEPPASPTERVLVEIWEEVLGAARVGVDDNLFSIGGDSILTIKIAARARRAGLALSVKQLFDHPTIRELAPALATEGPAAGTGDPPPAIGTPGGSEDDSAQLAPIEVEAEALERLARERPAMEDAYPLSPMQAGMLYHGLRDPEGGLYLQQYVFSVRTRDPAELTRVWLDAALRHPVMRTGIAWKGLSEPLQVVEREVEVEVTELDWSDADPAERERRRRGFLERDRRRGFDFASAPLWRLAVVRLAEGEYEYLWSYHHLLLDGWSTYRLLDEIFTAFEAGGVEGLDPVRPFREFIAWLRRTDLEAADGFWAGYLEGLGPPARLELPRPDDPGPGGAAHTRLDAAALDRLARDAGVTANTVVQGAWAILLSRLTDRDEVVFGATTAGRSPELNGVESILGCTINTLPVRARIDDASSARDWLAELQAQQTAARAHEQTPLSQIRRHAGLEGEEQLFDTVLVFENFPDTAGERASITPLGGLTRTNYPVTIVAVPHPGELELRFLYDGEQLAGTAIERLAGQLARVVEQLAAAPDGRLGEIDPLEPAERHRLLVEWNDTATPYPEASITELFEHHARATPEAPALDGARESLNYRELNQRANRIAHRLRAAGVGEESAVALLMPRSVDLVASMLGVLKAGGAYVPLDPREPPERLGFMLADAEVRVALTTTSQEARIGGLEGPELVCVDRRGELEGMPGDYPDSASGPDDLAYVIFTSGSTGRPKGVAIAHRGVVRLVRGADYADLGPDRAVLHQSAPTFDLSTFEVWGPLLNGGRCVLHEEEDFSVAGLGETIARHGVDTMWLTVSLFNAIVDDGPEILGGVRQLLAGGEAHSAPHVIRALRELPGTTLINGYGPTEATTFASAYTFPPDWRGRNPVPIGRPIANTTCYVVDRRLRPMPIGAAGELVIGGPGVARGYVGRAELTAERFVPSPFAPGERLYRTGDVCRWTEDGLLEYLGRVDHQVKVRGFRVELGEIEAVLEAHEGVGRAAVVAREDGGEGAPRRLVAYVVGAGERPAPPAEELRLACERSLPDYMVPAALIELEELPLNASGKLDRSRLPAPGPERPSLASEYAAPATPGEEELAGIWAEVLDLERVGVEDDFFELGGDSIMTIRLVGLARVAGIELTVRSVFEHPTVRELAAHARASQDARSSADESVPAEPAAEGGAGASRGLEPADEPATRELPLAPIQAEFFAWELERRDHFNQSTLIDLGDECPPEIAEGALRAVVRHHDALRLRFRFEDGHWWQRYAAVDDPGQPPAFEAIDLAGSADGLRERLEPLQGSFDLDRGPLVAGALLTGIPGHGALLFVAAHHLVVDAVSWGILRDDLRRAIDRLRDSQPVDLGPRGTAYGDWVRRLAERRTQFESEAPLWRRMGSRATSLPLDDATGDAPEAHAVVLDAAPTQALVEGLPRDLDVRADEVLLTALARALAGWAGDDRVRLDLEGHGREPLWDDLELSRTVGWFTSLYPVTLEVDRSLRGVDAVADVAGQMRALPSGGLGYGVLRHLGPSSGSPGASCAQLPPTSGDLGAVRRASLVFNYLGRRDPGPLDGIDRGDRVPGSDRSHQLSIDAELVNGRLRARLTFPSGERNRHQVERLAARWEAELLALAEARALAGVEAEHPGQEDAYPLTPIQLGMLYHTLREPEGGRYVEQSVYEVETGDSQELVDAWLAAALRHPVMRSRVVWEEVDEPLQVVEREVEVPIARHDWRGVPDVERTDRRERFLAADRERGFDFGRTPLWRLALIRTGERAYELVWTFHHLLLDGWSLSRLTADALSVLAGGDAGGLQPVRPFREYVDWLGRQDPGEAQRFWSAYLEGLESPTPLPLEHPQRGGAGHERHSAEVDAAAVERLARRARVTPNALLQGAWGLLLARLSDRDEAVFGATTSGRPAGLAGCGEIVGCLINTLPVRVRVDDGAGVADWLRDLQAAQSAARDHGHVALADLRHHTRIDGVEPIFETVLVFESYPMAEHPAAGGTTVRVVPTVEQPSYPLVVLAIPRGERLELRFLFDTARFRRADVERLGALLISAIERLDAGLDGRLGGVDLLADPERHRVVAEWNQTARPYPDGVSIGELFERQCRATPDSVALCGEDETLTYAELNVRANRIAHRLRELGVGADSAVGLALERSPLMIAAVIGILKAGGAYVPLDPLDPPGRLAAMLDDAGARLVVTGRRYRDGAASIPGERELVVLDADDAPEAAPASDPAPVAGPRSLAYVMFTSGSTGRPKGVAVEHRSVVRLVRGADYVDFDPGRTFLHHSAVNFDASTFEIWGALLNGGRCVLYERERLSLPAFASLIRRHDVDTLWITASVFNAIVDDEPEILRGVDQIVTGGEAHSPSHVERAVRLLPGARLVNGYGPTETTTFATTYRFPADYRAPDPIPIGRPVANATCYVVDRRLRPVPIGVPGELLIGGAGVARGYVGHPELTAERFVESPFAGGERLYRTGDMCRWREDGALDFLGRIDDQVKVRGYRVELAEVQAALEAHPEVGRAAVLALAGDHPGAPKRLVGYTSPRAQGGAPGPDELRSWCAERLPAYMIPSAYVTLEELPLSSSGKLDRSRLPAPEEGHGGGVTVGAPGNERRAGAAEQPPAGARAAPAEDVAPTETALAAIWAEVLGLESVGARDDFFELGGDSISSLRVVSRARRAGVAISVEDVFAHPTVRELAAVAAPAVAASGDAAVGPPDRPGHDRLAAVLSPQVRASLVAAHPSAEDIYPLTPMQRGMLYHGLRDPEGGFYVQQHLFEARTDDIAALEKAWRAALLRHPVMRTSVVWEEVDEPLQVVEREVEVEVRSLDWRGLTADELAGRRASLLREDRRRGFDFARGPLWRLTLVRTGERDHTVLWTYHHMLLDGWSVSLLVSEVLAALRSGGLVGGLPPVRPFRDYIGWLLDRDEAPTREFWRRELAGLESRSVLDLPAPEAPAAGEDRVSVRVEGPELEARARDLRLTVGTVVQGAWGLLLGRLTDRDDVVFGGTTAGRPADLPGVESIVGCTINTLPIRVRIDDEAPVGAWLAELQSRRLERARHEHASLAEVQRQAGFEHQDPFDTLLVFENFHRAARPSADGVELVEIEGLSRMSYGLAVVATPGEHGLTLDLHYDTERFTRAAIGDLADRLARLVDELTAHPDRKLGEVEILAPGERRELIEGPDRTAMPLAEEAIGELVARQARATPDATAVVGERDSLTYAELNVGANRVAHRLRAAGVAEDSRVALLLDRSPEMVVAMLGVAKAGGAYVPLDPSHPSERVAAIVREAGARVLVTAEAHAAERAAELREGCPRLDEVVVVDRPEALEGMPESDPGPVAGPHSLAYVIFTSGSTGNPKGVAVEHRSLLNVLAWSQAQLPLSGADAVLQSVNYAFDPSVVETFWPLLHGARLVLAAAGGPDPTELIRRIRSHEIAFFATVPSLLERLAAEPSFADCRSLRRIMVGGEPLPAELARRVRELLPDAVLSNAYGPTETTVLSTSCAVEAPAAGEVSIGRPIANTRCYVVDRRLRPLPTGVPGELVIGGAGVARGYLGQPGLTAERFVEDPFVAGERLFRTGDVCRRRADGLLEFVGRRDEQVKVRGFRVELGEVRSAVAGHPAVASPAVIAHDDSRGRRRIVAYFVPSDPGHPPADGELRDACARVLPDYMVPGAFVALDALPLTASGKLDRERLPLPDFDRSHRETTFAEPATPSERLLCEIWADVLGVDRVGAEDDFFALGGDSIASMKATSRARRAGIGVSVRDLFEHPTVRGLTGAAGRAAAATTAEQGALEGEVPLGPVQREFLGWEIGDRDWFNQSALLALDAGVSASQLRRALLALIGHHDSLRLRLTRRGAGWVQRYVREHRPQRLLSFEEVEHGGGAGLGRRLASLQGSLDLERGPLVAAALVRRGPEREPLAFVTAHHLAVDAVSWPILLEDLETALQQLGEGREPELPPKTTSYRAWVERLREEAARFEEELPLWERMGSGRTPLPLELAGAATPCATRDVAVAGGIDEGLLREAASRGRAAVDDLLVAALAWALADQTGGSSIRVDREGHGRGPCFDDLDLSRTVGWFTALYPLTVDLPAHPGPGAALAAAKRAQRAVPYGGLGYGVLRHLSPAGERLASQPAADVVLNFLGRIDSDPLPGLERHDLGPGYRPSHPTTVTAAIRDGRLALRLDFVDAEANRGTIEQLGGLCAKRLEAVVEHCLQSPAAGLAAADFPLASLSDEEVAAVAASRPGLEDLYPLSPMQLGMLYHSLRDPHGGHYVEQHLLAVDTDEPSRLVEAWRLALLRHPVMRTGLVWDGLDEPVQAVERDVEVPVRELDWRDAEPAERDERRRALLEADRAEGFDLARPPLWRLTLIRTGERGHELLWTFHHALLDGWSFSRLLDEALATFEAGADTSTLAPARPLRDYIAWLSRQDAEGADRFWCDALEGLDAPQRLELPPPPAPGPRRARRFEELNAGELAGLARRLRVTTNTVVQGAWALVLSRLTGNDDVVFGATTAGRPPELDGAEEIVGCLINTLPVRVRAPGDANLGAWLSELQAAQSAARAHDHISLSRIQRHAGLEADEALFDTLLVFENYPEAARPAAGIEIRTLDAIEQTNYPLTVAVFRRDERLVLRFEYDGERLDPDAIAPLARCLRLALEAFAADPDRTLRDVELVDEDDRRRLAALGEGRAPGEAALPSVVELFERQVAERLEATALEAEGVALTYAQLAERAAAITGTLRELGAGPETRVALVAERSPGAVAAALGILRAGAAYVPLDPAGPPARLRESIEAAVATIVVAAEAGRDALEGEIGDRPLVALDAPGTPGRQDGRPVIPSPGRLAYVIFTSGSTGRPKGVEVEHASLTNLVSWMAAEFEIGPGDRVLCKTPLRLDASIAPELIVTPCSGATMVLAPEGVERDPGALCELIRDEAITVAKFVPVALSALLAEGQLEGCDSLRHVFSAGEPLARATAEAFHRTLPGARLHNLYGPTEATVDAAFDTVEPGEPGAPPIGRPIAGARCHVVDRELRPLPPGLPGELAVGGAGVARGYAGDPALTAERFPASVLGWGERIYLTGDLCRFRADGRLEFLGRRDDQLKVRGHRIEPVEVEGALERHPAVAQAAVAAPADREGVRRLAAYLVHREGYHPPSADELRRHLGRVLPEQMIPAAFVAIERLPLTRAGKLDRGALPKPGAERPRLGSAYQRPATPAETVLADIVAEVLGLNRVGVEDDLFALGADSILTIKIAARARRAGLPVTVGQLFDHRSVRELAEAIATDPVSARGGAAGAEAAAAEQGRLEGAVPLTPTQIEFFEWELPARDTFTSHVVVELEPGIDPATVRSALRLAVDHHDAFRLRFRLEDTGWSQRYAAVDDPDRMLRLASVEAPNGREWEAELRRAASALEAGLDLADGPVVAAATVDRGPGARPLLFLAAHHLVVDSVSWRILLEDVQQAAAGLRDRSAPELPPKSTSFRGWAERLRARAEDFASQAPFWLEMTERELPLPRRDAAVPAGRSATLESRLDRERTARLVREPAAKHGIQVHDVLLAALARTVAEWRDGDAARIDVQGHGRVPVWEDIDLTRTVGWFASTYPLTIAVPGASGPDATLGATVRQLERVPASGLGYGICRYLRGDAVAAELARRPRSPVAFNYLGRFVDENRVVGLSREGWRLGERTPYVLSLAALVTGGELKLIWSYHQSLHDDAEIEQLARSYERTLAELIDRCASPAPLPAQAAGRAGRRRP